MDTGTIKTFIKVLYVDETVRKSQTIGAGVLQGVPEPLYEPEEPL